MEPCNDCKDMAPGLHIGIFPVYPEDHTGPKPQVVEMPCDICDGTGEVPDGQKERLERGAAHKRKRFDLDMNLRVFCKEYGLDPVLVSQYERGKLVEFHSPIGG